MSEEKREFTPMKAAMPNPNKIRCRNCIFRDKTTVKIGSKEIPCGVTKAECEMYQKPNFKPNEILFMNEDCRYYVGELKNG